MPKPQINFARPIDISREPEEIQNSLSSLCAGQKVLLRRGEADVAVVTAVPKDDLRPAHFTIRPAKTPDLSRRLGELPGIERVILAGQLETPISIEPKGIGVRCTAGVSILIDGVHITLPNQQVAKDDHSVRLPERSLLDSAVPSVILGDALTRLETGSVSLGEFSWLMGRGTRDLNQDAIMLPQCHGDRTVCGVLDGHGALGHTIAKHVAINLRMRMALCGCSSNDALLEAYEDLSRSLREECAEGGPDSNDWSIAKVSGTCIAVAEFYKGAVTICHAGDCRVSILRKTGELVYETEDHSISQELKNAGETDPRLLRTWRSNITKSISLKLDSKDTLHVCSPPITLNPGDLIILQSDGVTTELGDEVLKFAKCGMPNEIVLKVRNALEEKLANRKGSSSFDNFSFLALRYCTESGQD